jgi:hypothetical protein
VFLRLLVEFLARRQLLCALGLHKGRSSRFYATQRLVLSPYGPKHHNG